MLMGLASAHVHYEHLTWVHWLKLDPSVHISNVRHASLSFFVSFMMILLAPSALYQLQGVSEKSTVEG